ncbi:MAG: DUF434 domain-containing protein [Candidatus Methanofastidiosia archaeon]
MSIHDAREDLRYLLNRGYRKKSAIAYVCNHYGLTENERNLLSRVTFSEKKIESTRKKEIFAKDLREKEIVIDAYNVIITLESVVFDDPLICDDGVVRDDKGIFGKYRISEKTHKTIELLSDFVKKTGPLFVTFYIDKQVSKSGELAGLIKKTSWDAPVKTLLSDSVDRDIKESRCIVATADSAVIKYVDKFIDIPKHFLFEWV